MFLFLFFDLLLIYLFTHIKKFTFFRDFATATRNYAKRQMHWYRKDEKFLFVEIGTKSVTNKNDNEDVDNYDKNNDYAI